jgi:hypothetical protein
MNLAEILGVAPRCKGATLLNSAHGCCKQKILKIHQCFIAFGAIFHLHSNTFQKMHSPKLPPAPSSSPTLVDPNLIANKD